MADTTQSEILNKFRLPLLKQIIDSLELQPETKGMDIGCGIGQITQLLAQRVGNKSEIIGLDFSHENIAYAKRNLKRENIEFLKGDINNLFFSENTFDWIFCMDTLWVGPKEYGCPTKDPYPILQKLNSMLKPGGRIYLAYWTSQKFLPGYPLLEARLNTTPSANAPYQEEMPKEYHVMNARKWLSKAGFDKINATTFVGNINGPLQENDKKSLALLFEMLWGDSKDEVSKKDWHTYTKLCRLESKDFLPNDSDYHGFYTYSVFEATKM